MSEDWAGVTSPALPPSIFDEALEENRFRLQAFFDSPTDNVLDVSADTRAEATAFAARLVLASDLPLGPRQRAVVAKTVTGLQRDAAASPSKLAAICLARDVLAAGQCNGVPVSEAAMELARRVIGEAEA